jgi:hypothetical protein
MAPRRSPLSSLFAPPYVPGDLQSAQDVADWQAPRAGTWPRSEIERYQVPTPQTGVTAGFPQTTSVDPALLQAAAQNQVYTPGPNVTVQPQGGPAPGAQVAPAVQPQQQQQMPSRDDLANQLMMQLQQQKIDMNTGTGLGSS